LQWKLGILQKFKRILMTEKAKRMKERTIMAQKCNKKAGKMISFVDPFWV
jgi:hypothetical protein